MSGTPLRREGQAIGALIVYRDTLAPFTADELALQQSFADQAVIAIENARLFNEVQAKHELSEALQQQTATADILKVISRSAFDLQPVFDAMLRQAIDLCNATIGSSPYVDGDAASPATQTAARPNSCNTFARTRCAGPGTAPVAPARQATVVEFTT